MQNIIKILLSVLLLILSYPTAIILKKLTKDEKKIYQGYFSVIFWPLALISLVFYFWDITIALTLTFITLIIFFWKRK